MKTKPNTIKQINHRGKIIIVLLNLYFLNRLGEEHDFNATSGWVDDI